MSFSVKWHDHYVEFTLVGEFGLEGFVQVNDTFSGDQRFDSIKGVVLDMRGVTKIEMTEVDQKVISSMAKVSTRFIFERRIRFSYVVAAPEIEAFVRNYIDTRAHKVWDRELFHTLEDARSWVLAR